MRHTLKQHPKGASRIIFCQIPDSILQTTNYFMIWKDMIGYIAAFCTTFSFLPQAIQIIKTKDTSSILLSMYAIFTFGSFARLLFGWVTGNWPVIVANSITFLLAALILYFKIRYNKQITKIASGG